MSASIGEPFHLASYSIPRQTKSQKKQNLFAAHASKGYVTATVQGDGVHILDLATLHPVISHTLGPSTSFSCPSVSVLESYQNVLSTYSAIASSADVALDACGRTIWVWREDTSSTDRALQKKKAAVLPHSISEIFACTPRAILLSSPVGDWTLVDADLKTLCTLPTTSTTLRSFVFASTFLPAYSGSTTVVSLEKSQGDSTSARVLVVLGETEMIQVGSCELPVKPDQITAASCSPSGYLTVLTKDGSWNSFQIESTSDGIAVYEAAQPLRLKALSFIGNDDDDEVSLATLNTSLALLAAVTSSPRSIVLLLWDLQYSVLLASHSFPIPSTLSSLPKISIALSLTTSASQQALLILSAPPSDSAPPKSARSSIFAVPLMFPKSSTLGNAMGRAGAGAQWLDLPVPEETSRTKVLSAVQKALANKNPEAAEEAFFTWETSEREAGSETAFGHLFVSDILAAVLQPSGAYSPRIIKFLLEKRIVSASMVEGGLLAALLQHNDWNAIQLCTQTVVDLTESDLIFVLRAVIERSRATPSTNAMDIDTLGSIPSFPSFLNSCVRYRTSSTALRIALHQHLTQPEDVLAVLEIIDKWIVHWRSAEVVVMPSKKNVRKDPFGASVLKDGWRRERDDPDYPPLLKVLTFLQTLFDASFLALLQHTPAHPVLRRLGAHIQPEIQLTEHVDALRGPLEVFVRAQAKAVREAKEKQNGKDAGDWRQRRRLAHERTAMAAGRVYQVEELVL
ncbi:hypothetical protein C8F01DRAFT_1133448 [Mycena amicta]|nr:hypothetical protein C8F01DRAFT_1133448 [Mycena amicta]